MLDEIRHVLDTHPLAVGQEHDRDPVPGRRLLVRAAVTTARARLALTAGRAAGWASRVTGRGAGTQVSGRVMLGIEPELLAEVVGDAPRRARLGDQRQDDHDPPARRGAAGQRASRSRPTTPARTCPRASRPRSRREPRHRRGDHRGRRAVAAEGGRPARRRAARARQPHPRPARPLRRGAGDRRAVAGGLHDAPRRSASIANASDPHVVWAAEPAEPDLGRARRAVAQRRRHLPSLRRAARLVRGPVRLPERAGSPSRRPRTGSTATCSCSTASASRCTSRLPGHVEPDERGARARRRGRSTSRCRSAARSQGIATVEVVSGRFSTRRLPDGRNARVLLAKNPAGWTEVLRWLQGQRRRRRARGQRARGRRPRPVVALGRARTSCCAACPVAASGERALDVAVRLDYGGVDVLRRARPARRGGAAARVDEVRHHRVVHPVHPPDAAVVVTARVDGARRAGVPRAARDLRRPRQRGRPRRAVPPPRASTPSWSRSRPGTPIPDSLDVYLFGGGEDDPQVMAAAGMRDVARRDRAGAAPAAR